MWMCYEKEVTYIIHSIVIKLKKFYIEIILSYLEYSIMMSSQSISSGDPGYPLILL